MLQIRAAESPGEGEGGREEHQRRQTDASSVRGHSTTEARAASTAGGKQFGKNGLADYHWALKERCL